MAILPDPGPADARASRVAPSRTLGLAWLVPLALTLAHIVADPRRINADCGMFLSAGRLLLEGRWPVLEVVDTNPPLVMYASAVPAALERVLPLHATTIFSLLVLAAAAASTACLARLLRRPETGLTEEEARAAALVWATLSLAVDLNRSFGQRDHLFALAFAPYLVLRWVRWSGGAAGAGAAVALGLAAGLTACFRPFFVALLLLPEAYGLLAQRGPRRALAAPEAIAAALAGAAYGAHFLLLPPEVREAILERWGPQIVAGYHLWDAPLGDMLLRRGNALALALGLAPFALPALARARGISLPEVPALRLARLAALVTLACLAHFVLARKPWAYRSIPYTAGAALVLGLLLGPLAARVLRRRAARAAAIALACAALLLAWPGSRSRLWRFNGAEDAALTALVEARSRPGDAILFLSTSVVPAHPLTVQTDRRPATRYLSLFPMGFAYDGVTRPEGGGPFPYRAAGAETAEEARFLDDIEADVARSRPALIFVPRRDAHLPALPPGFDVEAYLTANGRLPRLLAGYRLLGRHDGHDAYERAPWSLSR